MLPLIELSPCDIRFMHHRINDKFSSGNSVNETIEKICRGEMRVEQLPKIRVVKMKNSHYAFDNRRLYVYRVLHYRGQLDTVTVHLAPYSQFQPKRYSTRNNGKSVIMRGGKALPHSEAGDQSCRSCYSNSTEPLEHSFGRLTVQNGRTHTQMLYDDDDDIASSDEDYNFHLSTPRQSYATSEHRPASSYYPSRYNDFATTGKTVYLDSSSDDEDYDGAYYRSSGYSVRPSWQATSPSVSASRPQSTQSSWRRESSTTNPRYAQDEDDLDSLFQPSTVRQTSVTASRVTMKTTTNTYPAPTPTPASRPSYNYSDYYQTYLRNLEKRKNTLKSAASTSKSISTNPYGTTTTPRYYGDSYETKEKTTSSTSGSYLTQNYSTLSRPTSPYSSSYATNAYSSASASRTYDYSSRSAAVEKKSKKESSCVIL